MKKSLLSLVIVILASIMVNGLIDSQNVSALNNFVIKNFDVEMELGKDSEGRSTLRTVETITADFQARNENRGLERVFVKTYDDHSTNFELVSVTDGNGNELPHHWNGDTLRIGDKDTFVYGLVTYKLTYTQRDVTRFYQDTNKDEFYWDAIGTEWRVPIEQASVRLIVAPGIRGSLRTDLECYFGRDGATDRCQTREQDGFYIAATQNIGNYSGMTVALGFNPGTFVAFQPSLLERLFLAWIVLTAVTGVIGVGVIIWVSIRAHRWTYRDAEMGTIIPEYLPPKNASVAVSAAVSPGYHSSLAAQLTDLAVRHYIQIIETAPRRSIFQPARYAIKVVKDISDLRFEEREVLNDMFGKTPQLDDRLALITLKNNTSVYARFNDNDKKLRDLMRIEYGIKRIDRKKRGWYSSLAKIILIASVLSLSPMLLFTAIVTFVIGKTLWVLSDEGLALRRYLKGLELYIKVAEKERIEMLQSPEGAEKVDIQDTTDPAQLVKLYERVLPYAILFGQEKEWSKRLGNYYESANSSPDWYTGSAAFNAVVFSSMMSNFSSSMSTASASSSSTGGSSGGGSSGGGGGGGGGGGW